MGANAQAKNANFSVYQIEDNLKQKWLFNLSDANQSGMCSTNSQFSTLSNCQSFMQRFTSSSAASQLQRLQSDVQKRTKIQPAGSGAATSSSTLAALLLSGSLSARPSTAQGGAMSVYIPVREKEPADVVEEVDASADEEERGQAEQPPKWLKIRAYYDDLWKTALPASNVQVSINGSVYKQGLNLNEGTGQSTWAYNLNDAQQSTEEPGVTVLEGIPEGDLEVEFMREPGIEKEIADLRQQLQTQLDDAYRNTVSKMSEFREQWDNLGYVSIAVSGAQGLFTGGSGWIEDQADLFEAETWANLGDSIAGATSKTLDFAAVYATDTYSHILTTANEAAEWTDDNSENLMSWDWWSQQSDEAIDQAKEVYKDANDRLNQHVDDAAEFFDTSAEAVGKLYKYKDDILNLPKAISKGDANKVQNFIDTVLMDIDPDLATLIKENPDFHTVLELIADHDSALTYFAYLDLFLDAVPPNFYSYVSSKAGVYVAIEIVLLIVLTFISAGAGAATRLAVLMARFSGGAAKVTSGSNKLEHAQSAVQAFGKNLNAFVESSETLTKLGKSLAVGRSANIAKKGSTDSTVDYEKESDKRTPACRFCKEEGHESAKSLKGTVTYE